MEVISTDKAPTAIGPYSQGIVSGGLIFFAGQISLTPEGDLIDGTVEEQTVQVLKNIQGLLESQNLTPSDVVKCTVFLSDLGDFDSVNRLYANYFRDHKPARSCVEVSALPKGVKVEIEVIAQI